MANGPAVPQNAVSVALLDAGVPLKRMFAAVTVAIPSSGRYALDPDKAEEEMEAATLVTAEAGRLRLLTTTAFCCCSDVALP